MDNLLSAVNGGLVHHIKGALTFLTMMVESAVGLTELPAPHYICMYRLLPTTPPSPSRHYRLIAGTNLPTPKGWIAWLAKADFTHITFAQGYYTIESKDTGRK